MPIFQQLGEKFSAAVIFRTLILLLNEFGFTGRNFADNSKTGIIEAFFFLSQAQGTGWHGLCFIFQQQIHKWSIIMKMSKKYMLGLITVLVIVLCSGLAFSKDKLSPASAMQYFASLYAPYEGTRNAGFSMCFGNELKDFTRKTVETTVEMPERTFLK
ncbi:MAG: hypothetical protein PWR01_2249 [Clostridiales bacterium]|nr:hypothetical protein [Clostridiales bacterium]MDN5281176.1 hypothetical protein [Candidatus Ozemobacter sp.]